MTAACVACASAAAPSVVNPEGDLLLLLSLPLSVVIPSAAKDPGILRTTHIARTFPPCAAFPDPCLFLSSPPKPPKREIANNHAAI
jgi:hypothetical protein